MKKPAILTVLTLLAASPALADAPTVLAVTPTERGGSWTFAVTLAHDDSGWDHYADGWRVEREDGSVLGERVLYHPHVDEQPFTRSLSGVTIPAGVSTVYIRARDTEGGWDDTRSRVDLK